MSNVNNDLVDVHNSILMIDLGIHPPFIEDRDPEVWTKSVSEKELIKKMRRLHKGKYHLGFPSKKEIPVQAKLIVQLKSNDKFPDSTYSSKCYMHQISDILSYYGLENINKYIFNGTTYKPGELPFWF
jgi:hypothetical protein